MRAHATERIECAHILRPLSALEAVVRLVPPGGDSCFGEHTVEHEDPVGLGRACPLDERIEVSGAGAAVGAYRGAPLARVRPRARAVLRGVNHGPRALPLEAGERAQGEPRGPGVADPAEAG